MFGTLSNPLWAAIFLVTAIAVTSSETAEPTATLTTLPPAISTGNNTDPCAFYDRATLFNRIRVDIKQYNVSLLLQTCPELCALSYGFGNPDISGVGAMISYVIEGAAVFQFGPLLAIASLVVDLNFDLYVRYPNDKQLKQAIYLAKTSLNICQGVTYIALSVAIASMIRNSQSPPLHEQQIISSLCLYEIFICFGALVPFFLIPSAYFPRRKYIMVITLNILTCIVCLFSTVWVTVFDRTTSRAFDKQCFNVTNVAEYTEETHTDHYNGWSVFFIIGVIHFLFLLSIVCCCCYAGQISRLVRNLDTLWQKYLISTPYNVMLFVTISFAMFFWVFISWTLLSGVQAERKFIEFVSGDQYEESYWGFGQVTMMLIWLPLLNEVALDTYGIYSNAEYYRPEKWSSPEERVLAERRSFEVNRARAEGYRARPQPVGDYDEEADIPLQQADKPLISEPETSSEVRESEVFKSSEKTPAASNHHSTQVRQRTWPRNEEGTYLPARMP